MPKLIDVIKTVGSDAVSYFVTNGSSNKVANNAVVASTVVASPDIVTMLMQLSAGVDLQTAIATGGVSMYLAFGVVALRFGMYVIGKLKPQE